MSKRATDFTLRSISISSPRFEDEGDIDVTAIVSEINLYESLNSPFITGDMMMVDTSAVSNLLKAQGQETVTIELYTDSDYPLKKEFIIYSVRRQSKQLNSSSSIYNFSLIEKHGFFSYFQRLNKSYNGNIKDIIYSIYSNDLYNLTDDNLELDKSNFETPQQSVKVLGCNRTPLGLCAWLARRATSEHGEPFFLYSALRGGPMFRSLGSLISDSLVNPNSPYRYSQVYTNSELANEIYRVIELHIPESDNSIALARSGAFGILYQSIDPFNKTNDRNEYQIKFNQDKYFKGKVDKGRTFYPGNIYDDKFKIGSKLGEDGSEGQPLHELNSIIHSQINTSDSFEDFKSYDEEDILNNHLHKVSRISDLAFMNKQKIEATVPGYALLNSDDNLSIGKVFDIRIPSDKTHTQGDEDNLYDLKKTDGTGLYLSTKVRHRFKSEGIDQSYVAVLELAKLSTPS